MKITLQSGWAGYGRGTVLDLPAKEAKDLVAAGVASDKVDADAEVIKPEERAAIVGTTSAEDVAAADEKADAKAEKAT